MSCEYPGNTLGYASFLRFESFGEFFMSKFEVTAVAILASPVLLHLLKRFLPLKAESKPSVTNNYNAPVYFVILPHAPPITGPQSELIHVLADRAKNANSHQNSH
jgi:hypothetical protein